jgi:hypothetical protein
LGASIARFFGNELVGETKRFFELALKIPQHIEIYETFQTNLQEYNEMMEEIGLDPNTATAQQIIEFYDNSVDRGELTEREAQVSKERALHLQNIKETWRLELFQSADISASEAFRAAGEKGKARAVEKLERILIKEAGIAEAALGDLSFYDIETMQKAGILIRDGKNIKIPAYILEDKMPSKLEDMNAGRELLLTNVKILQNSLESQEKESRARLERTAKDIDYAWGEQTLIDMYVSKNLSEKVSDDALMVISSLGNPQKLAELARTDPNAIKEAFRLITEETSVLKATRPSKESAVGRRLEAFQKASMMLGAAALETSYVEDIKETFFAKQVGEFVQLGEKFIREHGTEFQEANIDASKFSVEQKAYLGVSSFFGERIDKEFLRNLKGNLEIQDLLKLIQEKFKTTPSETVSETSEITLGEDVKALKGQDIARAEVQYLKQINATLQKILDQSQYKEASRPIYEMPFTS